MATESQQELVARELLEARFGVVLRKIAERANEPTPDYELIADGVRVAVVEVKTLQDVPRTAANGWTVERPNAHTESATRTDNTPARIAAHIHKAAKQLAGYSEPKVLVLVSEEDMADVLDLEEAVQGIQPYGTESTGYIINTASMHIAEGRIREDRWIIDLYVWIEPKRRACMVMHDDPPRAEHREATDETVQFRVTSEVGLGIATKFFGAPADLPRPAATTIRMSSTPTGDR